ncbi:MAG: hypothetical protein C0485_12780 [Pirellula sp.]|nr:hypothetical protein [Pirellula sp.]
MREELNHGGTTGTTEGKRKGLEPPINADGRRSSLLAFIRGSNVICISLALLASLAVNFLN